MLFRLSFRLAVYDFCELGFVIELSLMLRWRSQFGMEGRSLALNGVVYV